MFINVKNPPPWDRTKSFFEQHPEAIQFWLQEQDRITNGVIMGGYFIHPWLYWHINHFKTPIPTQQKNGQSKDIVRTPSLDDNAFFFAENYQDAEENGKGLFLYGCRGYVKSTILTSISQWKAVTTSDGVISINGGSAQDLRAISMLLKTAFTKVHPALFLPTLISDWNAMVELGWMEKDKSKIIKSTITVTNIDGGKESASEKGAGGQPVCFILDEAGKVKFKKMYESAQPSFVTPSSKTGMRLVPLLTGTAGNEALSKDATDIISNPEAFGILPMNWERLERGVDPEYITWKHNHGTKFGTFAPGQMSYRVSVPKIETTLGDYLKIDDKDLKSVNFRQTDWKNATEYVKNLHTSKNKQEDQIRDKMYFPLSIDDIFSTKGVNPFPVAVIKKHIQKLESEGNIGKNIAIHKECSETKYTFSEKKRAAVSHPGGNIDAPVILFRELPLIQPPLWENVCGLDDYKTDTSTTDSLGALYVLRRRFLAPNEPMETIVCSLVTKPNMHVYFHRGIEQVQEATNAVCLMESIDVTYLEYLRGKNKAEQLLYPELSFAQSFDATKRSSVQKFGMSPHKHNNTYRMNLMIDAMNEQFEVGIDDDGNSIIKYGVEFVDDIDLLKEMVDYYFGGNFDRITAYSYALVLSRELDKQDIRPIDKQALARQKEMLKNKQAPRNTPYSSKKYNAFR